MLKNFGTKTATELTYLGKAKDLVSGIPLVGKYFEAFGKGAGKGIEALETVSKYPDRKYGVNMFNDPQFNKYVKDAGITKDQPLNQYFYPGINLPPEVLKQLQQENA